MLACEGANASSRHVAWEVADDGLWGNPQRRYLGIAPGTSSTKKFALLKQS